MSANVINLQVVGETFANPTRELVYTGLAAVAVVLWLVLSARKTSKYPLINNTKGQWSLKHALRPFNFQGKEILRNGFAKLPGPFQMTTMNGPQLMLSPESIDAVNDEPALDFKAYTEHNMLSHYSTFPCFRASPRQGFEDAILRRLTRGLPKFTKPMSEEMSQCLKDTWGDSTEWHDSPAQSTVLSWVSRMSSRIFNGVELTRNKEWLRITVEYTTNTFVAVMILKVIPLPFRWLCELLLPICRKIRSDRLLAAKIFQPIVDERRAIIAKAAEEGVKPDLPDDAIEWFRSAAKGGEYGSVNLQLSLAIAGLHTTSDLLGQTLLFLASKPELQAPLREEAIAALSKHGLQKAALLELRLLDSFFKEVQRLKPIAMVSMNRMATRDVTLADGTSIKKGELCAVSAHRQWSPDYYEDPHTFNPYRFLERRKIPGQEVKSLLISTSSDHMGFSYGKHACPGRFFADNEVKIAMLHILLKYDLAMKDPAHAQWGEFDVLMYMNPKAELQVRRRLEEVDIDALTEEAARGV